MKKILLYIIVFILSCTISSVFIDYTVGEHIENQSPYYLSFASIGANSLESRIDCWAKIKTTSSTSELEAYMFDIVKSLGLPADSKKFKYQNSKNSIILSYELGINSTNYSFVLESNEIKKETYFIIKIICKDKKNIDKYVDGLNKIIGLNWTFYYQYNGKLNMIVDKESQKKLIDVMMKNLKTKNVEFYSNGRTISATGYSEKIGTNKNIKNYKINRQNVNIQIAVQVDEIKKETNVILGTPLILGEY